MATRVSFCLDHRFGESDPLSVGVEEELLLVDRDGAPVPGCKALVVRTASADGGCVVGEIYDETVELVTPVCRDAPEAVAHLARLRGQVRAAGATLLAAGLHPAAGFGPRSIAEGERYHEVAASLAGFLRTPTCALHVHVGMPDPESAIRACNGMRRHVPLLQALSANSAFWYGQDSGLASARAAILRSYPRARLPGAFHDYEDFCATAERLAATAEVRDYTYFWWDLRPHPRLGTLEVRAMDVQGPPEITAGLVALVHGLVARPLGEPPGAIGDEALDECCFRAARYGMHATLGDGAGRLRPVPELAREAIDAARPFARERGCEDALGLLECVLREGNGADRQRAVFRRLGMAGLLRRLVADTAAGPYL